MRAVEEKLFELQDKVYRDFQSKLMPTVDYESIIGVRTPALRRYARELYGTAEAEEFLKELPHKYYEENNLHSFLIEQTRDFTAALYEVRRFLPYVDNWATCDTMCPKTFKKHTDELLIYVKRWISSEETYTIRYGLNMLMRFFLGEGFKEEYLYLAAAVKSEEYYVNMMLAWFFATALAKQYDAALNFLTEKRLPKWVHNKTIQKAVESYRITEEQKSFLRTLRIK